MWVMDSYFEGESGSNELAQRGYSRDHRPDCKQVCIALVVSKEGLPLGYEVFAGNRGDVTTVEEIVEKIETQYGAAGRIWVMDRGMVSGENLEYLQAGGRRYIVGTPKSQLKRFEQELLKADWQQVREGLEVKLCPSPDGEESFILCRSAERAAKEKAIHDRFERRIEKGLTKLADSCRRKQPSEYRRVSWESGPSGIRRKNGFRPIYWSASWPMCYGRCLGRCAKGRAWAANHARCSTRFPRSRPLT